MRIENVTYKGSKGKLWDEVFLCDADVTTGWLWWKRTERREAFKEVGLLVWRFTGTGEAAPRNSQELFDNAKAAAKAKAAIEG